MEPFPDVQRVVLALGDALPVEDVLPILGLGRVLAEDIVAEGDVPSFANSAMDGFAVRAVDVANAPVELRVIGRVGAGGSGDALTVGEGDAVKIMTGAPVPAGADAVVMVEHTSPGAADGSVRVERAAAAGDAIRWPGEDMHVGDVVLRAGAVLTAANIGLVASCGYPTVSVHRRVVVGVFSTGDELRDASGPLESPAIRDSNRPMMAALAARDGATVVDFGIVPDDDKELDEVLKDAAQRCDLVITSGGVSMGDADLMKQRLTPVQVAIKPAKPLAYGLIDGTPVVGLPGNPVSSLVSYTLFVRPLMRRMQGFAADEQIPALAHARLAVDAKRRPDGKTHLVRVTTATNASGEVIATPVSAQGSHQLAATASATALALIPDGDGLSANAVVETILL